MQIIVENINSHGGCGKFPCLKLEMYYWICSNHRTVPL